MAGYRCGSRTETQPTFDGCGAERLGAEGGAGAMGEAPAGKSLGWYLTLFSWAATKLLTSVLEVHKLGSVWNLGADGIYDASRSRRTIHPAAQRSMGIVR